MDYNFEEEYPHRLFLTTATKVLSDSYGVKYDQEVRRYCRKSEATLISSRCVDGQHAPALDIDFGARLVPSSTPGHYHLFLDKPMPWRKYKRLLKALRKAGIIEYGYYRASLDRQATHLRTGKK